MNIVKITDIVNEKNKNAKYLMTELSTDDIKGIIAAFQQFIAFYTDYGEYCNVSKDMIIYLLTGFFDCQVVDFSDVDDINIDNWIDITEILCGNNYDNELYLPLIRKIKKTTFMQKLFNFFDDEKYIDYINEYSLKTILKSY